MRDPANSFPHQGSTRCRLLSAEHCCRRALWRGFMQACNDTEQVASMNGMDASSAQLDWFGVPVKVHSLQPKAQLCPGNLARSCHSAFTNSTVARQF